MFLRVLVSTIFFSTLVIAQSPQSSTSPTPSGGEDVCEPYQEAKSYCAKFIGNPNYDPGYASCLTGNVVAWPDNGTSCSEYYICERKPEGTSCENAMFPPDGTGCMEEEGECRTKFDQSTGKAEFACFKKMPCKDDDNDGKFECATDIADKECDRQSVFLGGLDCDDDNNPTVFGVGFKAEILGVDHDPDPKSQRRKNGFFPFNTITPWDDIQVVVKLSRFCKNHKELADKYKLPFPLSVVVKLQSEGSYTRVQDIGLASLIQSGDDEGIYKLTFNLEGKIDDELLSHLAGIPGSPTVSTKVVVDQYVEGDDTFKRYQKLVVGDSKSLNFGSCVWVGGDVRAKNFTIFRYGTILLDRSVSGISYNRSALKNLLENKIMPNAQKAIKQLGETYPYSTVSFEGSQVRTRLSQFPGFLDLKIVNDMPVPMDGNLFDNQDFISAGTSCKSPNIFVLYTDTNVTSGGTEFDGYVILGSKIIILNNNDAVTFTHEYSHAFANLADEYAANFTVRQKLFNMDTTMYNIGQYQCTKLPKENWEPAWYGDVLGVENLKGCILEDAYRSSEYSLMNSGTRDQLNPISCAVVRSHRYGGRWNTHMETCLDAVKKGLVIDPDKRSE